jgi:hypothetical protein
MAPLRMLGAPYGVRTRQDPQERHTGFMVCFRYSPIVAAAVLALAACSAVDAPYSSPGRDSAAAPASMPPAPSTAPMAETVPITYGSRPRNVGTVAYAGSFRTDGAVPSLGTTSFEPPGVTPGASTGTYVGRKVTELRDELRRLQAAISDGNQRLQGVRTSVIEDSQRYHGAIAGINTRLQVGTTPGNPILIQQFNAAEGDLDRLANDVIEMNKMVTSVNSNSNLASYLAEATRATFSLSGAVDEDHRQLAILQDEVDQTLVLIDRLLSELSQDIRRQTEYVASERSNLNLLASGIRNGEIYGSSFTNHAMIAPIGTPAPTPVAALASRRPLVVIRFDRPTVAYKEAVYNAVSKVIERRPNAAFDLVAVTPDQGSLGRIAVERHKARRSAEGVMRALVDMGLPTSRLALSAAASDTATVNEVHIYVR